MLQEGKQIARQKCSLFKTDLSTAYDQRFSYICKGKVSWLLILYHAIILHQQNVTEFIAPLQQFTTVASEVRGKEEDAAAWFFLALESHEKEIPQKGTMFNIRVCCLRYWLSCCAEYIYIYIHMREECTTMHTAVLLMQVLASIFTPRRLQAHTHKYSSPASVPWPSDDVAKTCTPTPRSQMHPVCLLAQPRQHVQFGTFRAMSSLTVLTLRRFYMWGIDRIVSITGPQRRGSSQKGAVAK